MSVPLQVEAADYLRLGFGLVPIPRGTKAPLGNGWQTEPVREFNQLGVFARGGNVGLLHAASGTGVLDIDNFELAVIALEAAGINLQGLLSEPGSKIRTPKSLKPIYLVPEGVELGRRALAWKDEHGKACSIFELREGSTQDLLPPSLHPSGVAYQWEPAAPKTRRDIPELPGGLRTLWENWSELKPLLEAASPWYAMPKPKPVKTSTSRKGDQGVSVIDAFNVAHDVREILKRNGYVAKGKRFVAPGSSTGLPGVNILAGDDGVERAFSHHGSDLLGDGFSHDTFSTYSILEYGGGVTAAVRAAADELGITRQKPSREVPVEQEPEGDQDKIAEPFPKFPLEVFPEAVRCLVDEGAAALPVPADNLAVAALALAGAAIGTSRELEIKPGWREGPRIYAAIVAEPGSKKSPALNLAAKPFHDKQRAAHLTYRADRIAYETKLQEYETDRLTWRSSKGEGAMPTPPVEPIMAQVFTTDATLEATAGLLERNPRGIVLLQDELSAWAKSMGQYKGGKGTDRQKYLSFWSGSPEIVNRKGQEPIVLANPFVGVIGNMPPDILGELSDEQGREDGFIHRVAICFPDPVPLAWTEANVSTSTQDAYGDVFTKLWQLEPEIIDDAQTLPKVLRLSESGREAFREWINAHYQGLNEPNFSPRLRGPWAKMEGYVARFALILHCLRQAAGEPVGDEVDAVSVYGAATLADYFKAHAHRAYGLLHATALEKQAAAVLEYLERQPGKRVSLRDLVRSGAGKVRDAKGARAVLEQLRDQGMGEFVELAYPSGQKGEGFELAK